MNERCVGGQCLSDPVGCDDSNPCTSDHCDPTVPGGCVHTDLVNGAICGDANMCHGQQTCESGSCIAATPPHCDDGNLCNGTEGCVPETGQCVPNPGPLLCTPGNGGSNTCAAEWYVVNPSNPEGVMSKRQICHQGDPTCDFDADPTTCSFHVAICLRVPDPRTSCTPVDVSGYTLRRPTMNRDAATAGVLMAAIDALPGVAPAGRQRLERAFTPPIDTVRCTSIVTITVPAGRVKNLIGMASTVDRRRDIDGLRLRCVAR